MEASRNNLTAVEITDERSELARRAVHLIHESIWDVQPAADLLSEIEESRRGLPSGGGYHLIGLLDLDKRLIAAAAGVYLEAVNAGFITYLAVQADHRDQGLGRELRRDLVAALRREAQLSAGREPAWIVGEVRRESRWLRTLVRTGGAIPFPLSYFHPWLPRSAEGRYILYREPVGDFRTELPTREVLDLLYAIWRRAYRIDFPLQSDTFCYMLDQLEGRTAVVQAG